MDIVYDLDKDKFKMFIFDRNIYYLWLFKGETTNFLFPSRLFIYLSNIYILKY